MKSVLKDKKQKDTHSKESEKQKTELMNQMQSAGIVQKDVPDIQKDITGVTGDQSVRRGPGRPRGSTSKSPKRREEPPPPQPRKSAQDVSNLVAKRRLVSKLRALKRFFPSILERDLLGFDPHSSSVEELKLVVDSCQQAVSDEVHSQSTPQMLEEGLDQIEKIALQAALSGNPNMKHLSYMGDFAKRAKSDPSIYTDLRLISIDLMGLIPTNPYYRLAMNLGKCALTTYRENSFRESGKALDPDKFKEF